MGGTRTLRLSLAALALGLLAAPAARADSFQQIFHDYQRTGKINPCKYSQQQLKQALGEVPNDIQAYAPDFPNALEAAAEQRASGACKKKPAAAVIAPVSPAAPAPPAAKPPGTSAPAPANTTPAPTPDLEPARAASDQAISRSAQTTRASDAGTPAPVVALAVLAALLALGGLGYGLARWLAFDPEWAQDARHAVAEAGWRASATWAEFTDWVRLGR